MNFFETTKTAFFAFFVLVCMASPSLAEKDFLSMDKKIYEEGKPVTVYYENVPGNQQDWITIQPISKPDNTFGKWTYTQGKKTGSFTIKELSPGEYQARLYFNWPQGGYIVRERIAFKVRAKDSFEKAKKRQKWPKTVAALQGRWKPDGIGDDVVISGYEVSFEAKKGQPNMLPFIMYDGCPGKGGRPNPEGVEMVIADGECYTVYVKDDFLNLSYFSGRMMNFTYKKKRN